MHCPTLAELPPPPAGKTGWPWTEETPGSSYVIDVSTGEEILNWPKITIVTPSYNQGQYLEETIRSVLLQGYPNLEYIIVDDASTDGSVELIRKYESHLTWWGVNDKNSGQSYSINKGFTHASGDIHAYLNSDDCYEPGALYACALAFDSGHPWIVGQVQFVQEGAGYEPVPQLPGKRVSDWFVCCPISQPGTFWAAHLHHHVGPFRDDLHYFMDYEFWLRLRICEGIKPFILDQPIALYRLHPQSKTVAHHAAFAHEARPIREHYQQFLSRRHQTWIRIARRHRKARMHGSKAVSFLRQKAFQSATRELLAAFKVWPLFVFDLSGFRLALTILAGKRAALAVSVIGPEWDD